TAWNGGGEPPGGAVARSSRGVVDRGDPRDLCEELAQHRPEEPVGDDDVEAARVRAPEVIRHVSARRGRKAELRTKPFDGAGLPRRGRRRRTRAPPQAR